MREDVLAFRIQITVEPGLQTASLQNDTNANMDLRHTTGITSLSNLDKLQRFQSKTLRRIVNAAWSVRNEEIHRDLNMKYMKEVIKEHSAKYQSKLSTHPNNLPKGLLNEPKYVRLKRKDLLDLATSVF